MSDQSILLQKQYLKTVINYFSQFQLKLHCQSPLIFQIKSVKFEKVDGSDSLF